jgi:hypothetical protein
MPSLHHMYTHTPKYTSYTPPSIQIHVHKLHEFETQDFMEASKCLGHQMTQLFVGKVCGTFCFILSIMKQFGNPNFDIFFYFNFCSNEANKGIIL